MFTGIIVDQGRVTAIDKQGDWTISIATGHDLTHTPIGASIACSGVCLTVIEKTAHAFVVQVSDETLRKTAIGQWAVGTGINLEYSLKMGDELGGHLVFGHVDGLAEVISITPVSDSHEVVFALPADLMPMVAAKGSICLDGVSLTVNRVVADRIWINIIPHTWDVTSFGQVAVGQKIHVEIDMLARYVARQIALQMAK
jgi:riboflavin synthase